MKHHLKPTEERSANEDKGRSVEESKGQNEDGRLLATVLSSALDISLGHLCWRHFVNVGNESLLCD